MNTSTFVTIASAGLAALGCTADQQKKQTSEQSQEEEKTNFVFILTDDLGYGDIGCFGADDISTPNIDKMAKQGIQFTEFYAPSSVSSPSRAGLMTGRYPVRMGVNGGVFFPSSFTGMPPEEKTIAEVLKQEGYATGIVGKWHLGHREKYLPINQGFDYYFGIPYSNDMKSVVYMKNDSVVDFDVDQQLITKTYTEKACTYIDKHKDEPFFLFLAHSMPHVPIYASEEFRGTSDRGLYGDVIQELDWSVGQVIDKLKEQGILENTLVIFTSDNGPWLCMEHLSGSNGILREGKQTTFEGGMRVPTVAMWKGSIPAGTKYKKMVSMLDIMPTFAHIAGADLPDDRPIDGVNIVNVLKNERERPNQEFMYFRDFEFRAYRSGKWKVKKAFDGVEGKWWRKEVDPHPKLLFNLNKDPGEQQNLAEEKPEKLKEMFRKMDSARKELGELPDKLVFRTSADHSHREELREKED